MDSDVQNFISGKVQEAVSRSQNDLLSNLESLLSSKLDSFERKMSEKQKQISDSQVDRLQNLNDNYVFKRKSCEDQHKFNNKVFKALKEAEHKLSDHTVDSTLAAKEKIIQGIELLNHREKVIKLADSSEFGLEVVEEYEANPLADDSEDEKKMYRATMRAQRKVKAEKQRRNRQRRFQPYDVAFNNGANTPATTPKRAAHSPKNGLCYACGKPGHWRFECPEILQKQNAEKISINLFYCSDDKNVINNVNVRQTIMTPIMNG